jgi:hypothetical protein
MPMFVRGKSALGSKYRPITISNYFPKMFNSIIDDKLSLSFKLKPGVFNKLTVSLEDTLDHGSC